MYAGFFAMTRSAKQDNFNKQLKLLLKRRIMDLKELELYMITIQDRGPN